MIAQRITKARLEKKELTHKEEVGKLSAFALDKVSANYMKFSDLTGLDIKSKFKVTAPYLDI